MKKILLISFALFTLTQIVNSALAAAPIEPQICPSVSAIQMVGVSNNVVQNGEFLWAAGRRDQMYDTKNHWTFILGNFPAADASEARKKANKALQSLEFQLGPIQAALGKWVCHYVTAEGYEAVAITPAIAANNSAFLLG